MIGNFLSHVFIRFDHLNHPDYSLSWMFNNGWKSTGLMII